VRIRADLVRHTAAKQPAQFGLGSFQHIFARCREVLTGPVDVKFSIDIADWNGSALRRWLCSAECLSDTAMRRALRDLKMSLSRSSASLFSVTVADHRRWDGCLAIAIPLLIFSLSKMWLSRRAAVVNTPHGWKMSICHAIHRAGARTRKIPKALSMMHPEANGCRDLELSHISHVDLLNALAQRWVQ
jgi:hypothetical protein